MDTRTLAQLDAQQKWLDMFASIKPHATPDAYAEALKKIQGRIDTRREELRREEE